MAAKKQGRLKTPDELITVGEDEERDHTAVRNQIALDKVRRSGREWKRIAVQAKKDLELAEDRVDALLSLAEQRSPLRFKAKRRQSKSQSMPILIASDWHVEEEVGDETSAGAEYNLDIAEERIFNFGKNSLALVDASRAHTQINECILLLLGDHYTGHIHE